MGGNESVYDTHHNNSILMASWKNLGDQIVEKMASPWKRRSMIPKTGKQIAQQKTFVVVRERERRIGFIRASNSKSFFLSLNLKSSFCT